MTSDRPYPGQPYGPDGQQAHPDDPYAPQQRQPGEDPSGAGFSAFGDPQQPPPAQARAAVRIPNAGPLNAGEMPPPPATGGRSQVYGGGQVYGRGPQPEEEQAPPANVYGAAVPQTYGSPQAQPPNLSQAPHGYEPPAPPQGYEPPAQPGYGAPAPRTYGAPPQTYGSPQPQTYGSSQPESGGYQPPQPDFAQPEQYGQPQGYAPPAQADGRAAARVYGQPYQEQAAPAIAPERPIVPAQRTPAVYGRPAQEPDYPEPPRAEQPPTYGQRPAGVYGASQPDLPPDPSSGEPPRADRAVASWQDQFAPVDPGALMTPADVSVVGKPGGRGKLRVVGYIAIVVAVIALGAGALYYTSRPTIPKAGTCVTQNGSSFSAVNCSTSGAYKVGQKVTDVTQCTDYQNQPSLTYTDGGKRYVLCLAPAQ